MEFSVGRSGFGWNRYFNTDLDHSYNLKGHSTIRLKVTIYKYRLSDLIMFTYDLVSVMEIEN